MKKILAKIWPVIFIFIIWFSFASPYFLKGLIPFPSKYLVTFFPPWSASYAMPVKNNAMPDVISQIYPWKKITIDSWKLGQVPLWNPYSFSGTPHLANYQTAVFNPFNLLFLLLPAAEAWSWLILLQPLLAAYLMYLYLRSLNLTQLPGFFGSVAFMFCGFITVWMAYGTLAYAIVWLPLALYACQRFKGLLLMLSVALSLLAGHFQISLYLILLVGFYILYLAWQERNVKKGLILFIYLILGIFLAAPQLFPAFTAFQNSVRGGLVRKQEVIPWSYLVTIFAPDYLGNPVTRNDWYGHYAEWASYFGVVPLLFSLWGLFMPKNNWQRFFYWLALINLCFAFPTPLNDLIYRLRIPLLSTSAASRIVVLTSFSLIITSVFGFSQFLQKGKLKTINRFILFATIFLIIYWLVTKFGLQLTPEKQIVALRNSVIPTGLSILTLLIFWLRNKFLTLTPWLGIILLVLTGFDLLRFAGKWMPFDPKKYLYPDLPVAKFLQNQAGFSRLYGNFGGEFNNYFKLQGIEGYDAVYPARYGEFVMGVSSGIVSPGERSVAQFGKASEHLEKTLQLLGVKYFLNRKSDGRNVWNYPFWQYPHYQKIYEDDHYEVYENQLAMPRVFLVSDFEVVTEKQQNLERLFTADFPRSEKVTLEETPSVIPQAARGEAKITSYTPNEITIEVNTEVAKLLFLSDAYDPGWQVYLNGIRGKIYRANYDFRAVEIKPGKQQVVFKYWPSSFAWGLKTAVAALCLAIILSIMLNKYEDRLL